MDDFLDTEVQQDILDSITPDKREIAQQRRAIKALLRTLKQQASDIGQDYVTIEPQGSTGAKQTQLKGASDVDIFAGLDPENYSTILDQPEPERFHEINQLMDDLVEDWFIPAIEKIDSDKIQKTYSQHPYLTLEFMGYEVDILAFFVLDQKTLTQNGPVTAVDRTPHHTRYVTEHINEPLRDNIRLLKSFVRAAHAYGDKCAVGQLGITGYFLELVAIQSKTLKAAFDRITVLRSSPIDPLNRDSSKLMAIESFRDDYIIVIDPTDTERNVAASFSPRSVNWVIKRIHTLSNAIQENNLENIADHFIETPIPDSPITPKLSRHIFTIDYESDGKRHYTVLRDKLYSLGNTIVRSLETESTGESRFGTVFSEVVFEEPMFSLGFLVEKPTINSHYIRRGPPAHLHDAVRAFNETNSDTFEKDGYIWAKTKRKWTSASKLAKEIARSQKIRGLQFTSAQNTVSRKTAYTLANYVLEAESFMEP